MLAPRHRFVGLIIEPERVRVAQVHGGAPPRLWRVATPASNATPAAVAAAIRRALPSDVFTRAIVSVALPRHQVITRSLRLPAGTPAELSAMLGWQVERHVPYPRDQVVADYLPVSHADGQTALLGVFVLRDTLAQPLAVCERLGIAPRRVLFTSQALLNWHRAMHPDGVQGAEPSALLDIDADTSELAVVADGRLRWSRVLPHGHAAADALVQAVAEALTPDGQERVHHLYLTSAPPPLTPLAVALQQRLGEPCEVIEPLRSAGTPVAAEGSWSPVTVWGAALCPSEPRVNLLPPEMQWRQHRRRVHERLRRTMALAGALCVAAAVAAGRQLSRRRRDLEALRRQVAAIDAERRHVERTARRLQTLTVYLAAQDVPLQVLRSLQSIVPPETTLSSLTIDAASGVRLRATVASMGRALDLLQRLQAAPGLTGVEMTSATQRLATSGAVVDVALHCRVTVPGEPGVVPGRHEDAF